MTAGFTGTRSWIALECITLTVRLHPSAVKHLPTLIWVGDRVPSAGLDLELGLVDTEVTHLKDSRDRVVAGWRTTIGTREGVGFDVYGAHRFAFSDAGRMARSR